MPCTVGVLWNADPHTLAKHRLLENYLSAWLPTLLQGGFRGVTYAEGFAGPGIYEGGEPGSPVIALRTFLDQRALLAAGRSADMVLVEQDGRRLAELRRRRTQAKEFLDVSREALNRGGETPDINSEAFRRAERRHVVGDAQLGDRPLDHRPQAPLAAEQVDVHRGARPAVPG